MRKYRIVRSASGVSGYEGTLSQSMSDRSTFPEPSMKRSMLKSSAILIFPRFRSYHAYVRGGRPGPSGFRQVDPDGLAWPRGRREGLAHVIRKGSLDAAEGPDIVMGAETRGLDLRLFAGRR